MIDTQLGPYTLRAKLGSGGMATVYRAYQPTMDREVAIKVIHTTRVGDSAMRDRFRREARLIARLEHPHVVPVYDFDGAHEPPYIVMRYLDRGTLQDRLTQQQLSLADVAALLAQIAAALDYAHAQGIVHRDIKPSNILFDRHGNTCVTDFGIARIIGGTAADEAITGTGDITGTPHYIAPEQAQGRGDLDGRADVYALGIVLFQMLTGRLPFTADQSMAVLLQHMQAPVPSARAINPQLPPGIDALLAEALAKKPAARIRSPGALAERFAALVQAAGDALHGATTIALEPRSVTLPVTPTPVEQQRVVTIVAADAAEYGAMVAATSGEDAARTAVYTLWEQGRALVEQHGGRIIAQREHAILSCWGAEAAREDDAEQAVRAACALEAALRTNLAVALPADEPLPLAIGVHTGPALLIAEPLSGTLSASGVSITLAERLAAQAEGAVRISDDTYRLIRGAFSLLPDTPLKLRGWSEPLGTYRVTGIKAQAFRVRPRGIEGVETPLVGRDTELRQLQEAYLTALEEQETQAMTVIGDAGVGKSRLIDAFEQWADLRPERFWRFAAQATESTRNQPYALLRMALAAHFGIKQDDPPQATQAKLAEGIAGHLGAPDAAAAQIVGHLVGFELSEAPPHMRGLSDDPRQRAEQGRRCLIDFLTRLCADRPVLIIVDDGQNADAESLDLLSQLCHSEQLPLLLILAARPDMLECHRAWGEDRRVHRRIVLAPLDRRASRALTVALLARLGEVPRELRDLLAERSAGNPLYLEELTRMLLDERVIVRESDTRWHLEPSRLDRLAVPPTLYGLLQARVDALLAPERLTLQRASVVDSLFPGAALLALDNADEVRLEDPLAPIAELVARGFLDPRPATLAGGGPAYAFSQALLRDLIYATLLERQRRTYHLALADWMVRATAGLQNAALIAEQYRRGGQPQEAALWYRQAGDHARKTYAPGAAIEHYRASLALLPDGQSAITDRIACLEGIGEASLSLARLEEASASYTQMAALATQARDLVAEARAWNGLAFVQDANSEYRAAGESARRAVSLAEAGGATYELVIALSQVAWAEMRADRAQQALDLGLRALMVEVPVEDPATVARCKVVIAIAYEQLGDYGAARQNLEAAVAYNREVGNLQRLTNLLINLGYVVISQGDYPAALALLTEALQLAHESRSTLSEIFVLCNLAATRNGLGDHAAAESDVRRGIALCEAHGLAIYADLYQSLTDACLGQGRIPEALESAQKALDTARAVEGPREVAEALRALGAAASASDDAAKARACFDESVRLFAGVGVAVAQARALRAWSLAELRAGADARGRALWAQARDLFEQHGLAYERARTPADPPPSPS